MVVNIDNEVLIEAGETMLALEREVAVRVEVCAGENAPA